MAGCCGLGLAPSFAAQAAGWATYALDDSASRIEGPAPALRWRTPLPNRSAANLVLDATTSVHIVLNLAPFVGKSARIYMTMPWTALSSLAVDWVGAGTLQNGRLTGGQRQLVWQGVVGAVRLEDTLRVHASVDARESAAPAPVAFRFEIEVPAP